MRRNYFYNLLLTVFNLIVPIASFPYVSRILGPAGIGASQFALTFSQYVALLAALGIPVYGVREIGRSRADPEALRARVAELFSMHLISGILFSILLAGVLVFRLLPNADYRLLWWGSSLVLLSFSNLEWLFVGLDAFRAIAVRSIVVKVVALCAIFLCVRTAGDTPVYFGISLGAILVTNAINIASMRHFLRFRLNGEILRRHARPMLYIFGTTIASTLYTTFDSVLLGMLSSNRAVGLYTAASKISKLSLPVIMAYGGTLIPHISQGFSRGQDKDLEQTLNASYNYIVLLAIPVSAMLFALAPGLIHFFSGDQFGAAIPGMRIMAAFPLLIGLGYFWGYQVVLPMGRDRILLHAALCGTIVSLALNVALVPRMGENGAAIAGLAAELVVTSMYFILIRSALQLRLQHRVLWESLIASLPILACAYLPMRIGNLSLFGSLCVQIGGGTLVYLIIQSFIFRNNYLLGVIQKFTDKRRAQQ